MNMLRGYGYCVAGPSDFIELPAPIREGTPRGCTQYHVVVAGDECWSIAQQYNIDLDTLYKWNPSVGSNCGSLWPDYALWVTGGPA